MTGESCRAASGLPFRSVVPRIATRDSHLRVAMLVWLREFVAAHRRAFRRLRNGLPRPVFPFGSDLMRRIYGFKCEPRAPDFPVPLRT